MTDEAKQPAPVAPDNAHAAVEPQVAAAPAAKPLALPDDCNVVDCSSGKQQFWRFAKGKTQIVIDEAFSEGLSDAALRYVFVHELVHLKYDDPRRGYDLLKRIHQTNAKDTELMNNAFMTLLGAYGQDPEFKNFLDQAETRANHYASQHLIDRGENPCKAIAEIEQYTGARFRFGTEDLCK